MTARRVVLTGGHESLGGWVPGIVGAGRALHTALEATDSAVIVPMTLGRDPERAEIAAQTLRWLSRDRAPGALLLARPLGTPTHLIGWLRAAATGTDPGDAVLIAAPSDAPEQDAELFRVARLVRQYSALHWVEVALLGGDPDITDAIDRCRRLGARGVTVLPAALVAPRIPPDTPDVRYSGPLLGTAAVRRLIEERVADAEHRWVRHDDDGLGATAGAQNHAHVH